LPEKIETMNTTKTTAPATATANSGAPKQTAGAPASKLAPSKPAAKDAKKPEAPKKPEASKGDNKKASKKKTSKKKTSKKTEPAEKPSPLPKIAAGKVEKNIPLTSIVADESQMQAREKLSEKTAKNYAALMKDGIKFPPVEVFKDGDKYVLADGFHRLHAMKLNGDVTTEVKVRPGGKREALFFAIGANATHGLARSNDDKKKAVHMLLTDPDWKKCSDRDLAKYAGVSNVMVSKYRKTLKRASGEETDGSGKGSKGGRLRVKLTEQEQKVLDDYLSAARASAVAFSKKITSHPESDFLKRLLNAELRGMISEATIGKPAEPKRKMHPNNEAKKDAKKDAPKK
jgi:ParB-like chromosome segregation protein Spo0J